MTIYTLSIESFVLKVLLALGLLLSPLHVAQAAKPQPGQGDELFLPPLDSELRTVSLKKGGNSGTIVKRKLKAFAVYSTLTLDAFIDTHGALYVQPKVVSQSDGLCATMGVIPNNYYIKKGHPGPIARKLLSVKSVAQPARNPKTVTLNLEFESGVQSTLVYSFDNKDVEVEITTVDPKGIDFPSRPRLTAFIPPSHDIALDASMHEKTQITSACRLTLKKETYSYADFVKPSGRDGVSYGKIVGQWPGCEVKLSARPAVRMWVYPGSMLYEGYQMIVNDSDNPKKTLRMEVSVERRR